MKKLALVFSFFLILVFSVKTSFAQVATPSAPTRVRNERAQTALENQVDRRRVNVARHLKNMLARYKAMVVRLETLIERIEARIAKIEDEDPDLDLTQVKEDLGEAKEKLTAAETKIAELEALTADELVDADNPQTALRNLRAKLNLIKKDLIEVHRLLVHVVGDIKGLRVGENQNESE